MTGKTGIGGIRAMGEEFREVLSDIPEESFESALKLLLEDGFEVAAHPEQGMVMMTVLDPFDTPFHLGEILVTTAQIRKDGKRGFGLVAGDRPAAALLVASLDLIDQASEPVRSSVVRILQEALRNAAKHRSLASRMSALTRVEFSSMAHE